MEPAAILQPRAASRPASGTDADSLDSSQLHHFCLFNPLPDGGTFYTVAGERVYICCPAVVAGAVRRLPGAPMKLRVATYCKWSSRWAVTLAIIALSVRPCSAQVASGPTTHSPENRPAWLHETPIVMVSNHDSMPIFRRRVGGNPTWQEDEYYNKEHTEEAVRKLKELGVTVVVTHFYKGFGLEAESAHRKKALELVALVKKYGMKVGVY